MYVTLWSWMWPWKNKAITKITTISEYLLGKRLYYILFTAALQFVQGESADPELESYGHLIPKFEQVYHYLPGSDSKIQGKEHKINNQKT